MDSSSKEDFGNLGNLVVYLNGACTLEERIRFAKNIFFVPLNVPPQHKEEVVIVWLTDILSTNKVLTFSAEEVKLVWTTLKDFLTSKRIKILCSRHWVCPLTEAFAQVLITNSCGSAVDIPREIRVEALLICDSLFRLPSLSPQFALLSKQSLKLFASVLKLASEGYGSSLLTSQLTLLIQKSTFILNNEMTKSNSLCLIYEKLCLPLLEVLFILKDNTSEECIVLLNEIENFLFSTIFSKDGEYIYFSVLDFPLQIESKESVSNFGESFFSFFTSVIEMKNKSKASYILREFCICFFQVFKILDIIPYQLIINVMNILGIALDGGPAVRKDNLASRSLLPIKLTKFNQDRFIASIVQSVLVTDIDLNLTISNVSLKKWLEKLGRFLIARGDINEHTLCSLKIIIQVDPLPASKYSNLLSDLLVIDRTNMEITELLDEVLCEVLNVHLKLRTVDVLYEDLCENLLIIYKKNISSSLLQEHQILTYKKSHLLPCRFFVKFVSSINEMGSQMWLKMWSSIHKMLSQTCRKRLQDDSSYESVACVASTVWLSSCCLSASSVVEAVSVSGLPSKIAAIMNSLADECMGPLVKDMFQLLIEGKSVLCCSVLNFISVWAEVHSTLLSISTEYKDHTTLSLDFKNSYDGPKDLSPIIPFINKNSWKKIFALLNDKDDGHRSIIIQLMIQKVSLIRIHRMEIHVQKSILKDSSIVNILNYILEINDSSAFLQSTDIVAFHLQSLLSEMKKCHLNVIARWFIFGVEEERESWIKFGKSEVFIRSELLQSRCFVLLCQKFLALLSGRKRKLDEEEKELYSQPHHLTRKLIESLIAIYETAGSQPDFEKDFVKVLADIEMLFTCQNGSSWLKTKDEKQVIDILRILDMFPISFLQTKMLMGMLTFAIIMTFEEGGFGGRRTVTTLLLRIFHKVVLSSNLTYFFRFDKEKPFSILLWLQKECGEILKDVPVDEQHLQVILGERNHQVNCNTLQEVLTVVSLLTKSFVKWNEDCSKVRTYLEHIVAFDGKDENGDVQYLISALLLRSLRENLRNLTKCKQTTNIIKTCEILSRWSVEEMKTMILSKVTKVQMTWVLMTFSFLLRIKLKLKDMKQDGSLSNNDLSQANSEPEDILIEWDNLLTHGMRLAEVAVATEDNSLKTLGFDFYLCVFSSTRCIKNIDVWDLSERVWNLMFFLEDSNIHLKDFISVISAKQYKTVLKVILEKIEYKNIKLPKLFKWLNTFLVSSSGSGQTSHRVKSTFLEQLIGNLCIRFSDRISSNVSCYHSLFTFFITVLQTEKNISNHSRSLILGMVSHCSITHVPSSNFFQTFQAMSKLLSIIISSEHPFISNRPSCFMSAVTNMILSLLEKTHTDTDKGTMDQLELRELEKCCSEIEIVAKNIKHYDREFSKIVSFSLASILEKMQQTNMLPSVKLSMERIVCSLLDFSDPYALRHLNVTLSPSVITVLKHLHSIFNSRFKYDPRNA